MIFPRDPGTNQLMKNIFRFWLVFLSWLVMKGAARAQGWTFTCHGRLQNDANAAPPATEITIGNAAVDPKTVTVNLSFLFNIPVTAIAWTR